MLSSNFLAGINFLSFLSILIIGCSDDKITTMVIEDEIVKINIIDSIPSYQITGVSFIDNKYYILNNSEKKIYRLDGEFNFINSYGTKGKGPGEFSEFLVDMAECNNLLYVMDICGNITVLDKELNFIKTINLFDKSTKEKIYPNFNGCNNLSIIDDRYILVGANINMMHKSRKFIIGYLFTIEGEFLRNYYINDIEIKTDLMVENSYANYINDKIVFTLKNHNYFFVMGFEGNLIYTSDQLEIDKYFNPRSETETLVLLKEVFFKGMTGYSDYLIHFVASPDKKHRCYIYIYNSSYHPVKRIEYFQLERRATPSKFYCKVISSNLILWDETGNFEGLYRFDIKKYL